MTTTAIPAIPPDPKLLADTSTEGFPILVLRPPWQGSLASWSTSQLSTHCRTLLPSILQASEAGRGENAFFASSAAMIKRLCL